MEAVGILEMLLNTSIPDEKIITLCYVIFCLLLEISEISTPPYVYLTSGNLQRGQKEKHFQCNELGVHVGSRKTCT